MTNLKKITIDHEVTFDAVFAESSSTFWINPVFVKEGGEPWSKKEFKETFSYLIPGSTVFENIKFDENRTVKLVAERYGGSGIGPHGGGVRCGNLGNFQIKGCGTNPLSGLKDRNDWHNYGGLNLVDAAYEAVNSIALNEIMPLGAAKVYGIIVTDDNSAYIPAEVAGTTGYGALLVRDICIRPAHFLRAPSFKRTHEQMNSIACDIDRVRKVNKNLANQFPETNQFVSFFGKMLADFANQFAFAKIARIAHGSISPSNMSIDGRWLDLTNVSFLESAVNSNGSCSFYQEPMQVLKIIEEFLYTFSKYNGVNLNPTPLFNYYLEQLGAYSHAHVSYILGVDFSHIPEGVNNSNLLFLSGNIQKIILSAEKVSNERCTRLKDSDPLISCLQGLFLSVTDDVEYAKDKLNELFFDEPRNMVKTIECFSQLMKSTYYNYSTKSISYGGYLRLVAILSLKRFFVSEFFFMGRMESYIYKNLLKRDKSSVAQLLDSTLSLAKWGFDKDFWSKDTLEKSVTIFKGEGIHIYFAVPDCVYEVEFLGEKISFYSYCDSVEFLKSLPKSTFTISKFYFVNYLEKLLLTLGPLDKFFQEGDRL